MLNSITLLFKLLDFTWDLSKSEKKQKVRKERKKKGVNEAVAGMDGSNGLELGWALGGSWFATAHSKVQVGLYRNL